MFDHNGLQLTEVSNTMNSYRLTAIDLKRKKIVAYAASSRKNNKQFAMHNIGHYDDPRDAAYVAQEFANVYNKDQVRQMVIDGTFRETARDFCKNIEIPEWKFPAEGMSIQELIDGCFSPEGYRTNYINNAREALVEAIRFYKMKAPDIKTAKTLIEKVEKLYNEGITYRQAAKETLGV